MVKAALAAFLCALALTVLSLAASAACVASYVPSANAPYTSNNFLYGVVGVDSNDAWAAGYAVTPNYNGEVTLAERYRNGTWSVVPTINPSSYYNSFSAIDAVSGSDLWAVGGMSGSNAFLQKTLTEHWDGKSFKVVASPNIVACHTCHPYANLLYSVAAVSSNDVWAVGEYSDGIDVFRGLAMHWDGHSWSFVNPSIAAEYVVLYAVTKIAHDDVWAAGIYRVSGTAFHPLFLHWNGSQWTQFPGIDESSSSTYIYGLSATSTNDVWAVGYGAGPPVAEHWNGIRWSAVPTAPNVIGSFVGVAATSPSNAWAIGNSRGGTLVERWDGRAWSATPSANPGKYANLFFGAGRIPGSSDAWGVGYDYPNGNQPYHTLTELAHCL